jgi:hypothetical protein
MFGVEMGEIGTNRYWAQILRHAEVELGAGEVYEPADLPAIGAKGSGR